MRYFRLTDRENKGMILRAEGSYVQSYRIGRGWVRDGIMIRYTFPESDTYDMYEEIDEAEAISTINSENYRF